jgi:hypothetical protein
MVLGTKDQFYRLEVEGILKTCEGMSMILKEQKAEGYMYTSAL